MAAVFIPPSPQASVNMSTRRHPLANVPNATNSPHRPALIPVKRARTNTASQADASYGQPPLKRPTVDTQQENVKPNVQGTDLKAIVRRPSNNGQQTTFEKKLVAAKDKDRQLKAARAERAERAEKAEKAERAEAEDNIRQWQKHYRKVFPQFVFYFDGMPEDTRSKCSKQVLALGAVSFNLFV